MAQLLHMVYKLQYMFLITDMTLVWKIKVTYTLNQFNGL